MALNVFVIKKWSALLLAGFLPTIAFAIGLLFYSFWIGLIMFLMVALFGVLIGSMVLKNPFTDMLEGKGLMVLNIDSTGIIKPFIVGLDQPYVRGRLGSNKVDDVYNRETVLSLAQPVKQGVAYPVKAKEGGGMILRIPQKEFNASRFGIFHYPCLIYNAQVKSLVTKDFLSGREKEAFAEHGVLYLNRKLEELTSSVRNFGRHIVDLTRPKTELLKNRWVQVIIMIMIIVLIALFAKPLIQQISSGGGTVGGALGGLSNPVTPR